MPVDCHVHTEWSWDAPAGSLAGACAAAVDQGLAGIAFTEHADLTAWFMPPHLRARLPPHFRARLGADGVVRPPQLDVDGHAAAVAAAQARYPDLTLSTGVEVSEPHWHPDATARLATRGRFGLVLGSVHAVEVDGRPQMIESLFADHDAEEVLRRYLHEVWRMVTAPVDFDVLAHVDYPVRSWPADAGAYEPERFEDAYLSVLGAAATSGRALEVNTKRPFDVRLVEWWRELGGTRISIGSDAHEPTQVGRNFARCARNAAALGYAPDETDPRGLWRLAD